MYQRLIKVSGNAEERGRQIGKLLRPQIVTNYENQCAYYRHQENFAYADWEKSAERYIPAIEKWAPDVLQEMRGMAEGAELPFRQILALTTAYEKSFGREQGGDKCTSFLAAPGATKNGAVIIGQTNDECFREWLYQLDIVIHHEEAGNETLIYTHPGVPAYMGINNHGLAVMWTYIDNGVTGNGLPTNVIIRKLLTFRTANEAAAFLEEIPHDIPNQFGLADKGGTIISAECFPNKVYTKKDDSYLIHANHTVFAPEKECTCSKTTWDRYEVMEKLVKENLGKIDAETAESFFRCHDRFPNSICSHPYPEKPWNKTLAAMVFDLGKGEMNIAFGNPCEAPYRTFAFDRYPM